MTFTDPNGRAIKPSREETLAQVALQAVALNDRLLEQAARRQRSLGKIEGWSRYFKEEARTQLRGSMELIHQEAQAALAPAEEDPPHKEEPS